MSNNLILVDVDGVLLKWYPEFLNFLKSKNLIPQDSNIVASTYDMASDLKLDKDAINELITEFNNSSAMRYLSPMDNAVDAINKLKDKGFSFVAISSLSGKEHALDNRKYNISEVFGKEVFDEVHCIEPGLSKEELLKKYSKDAILWIEDHPGNAELGHKLGIRTVLALHPHNTNVKTSKNIIRIDIDKLWTEIENIVN
ncbi:hypothetical protein EST35_0293 [Pseudomonas phage vB_PaeM_PA5oct]|uniref:Uncharacterized protein n=1 Tax=Pseudomonas phage vB_PaeM_PA5oct TaxID=2163605 RepID=A0A4Y5JU69_9CAUD|nr:unknown function [Pseudomonas phage vB_PaeM_PA5oct]QCG76174.1 hypothetical protein EST35_0293 [Pseudomonas phage vB_PaeM_PA5oct]